MAESKLTKKQVRQIARLADLQISPGEIEKFRSELSGILEYIDQLNEIGTQGVEPTNQVTGLENVFRQDKVGTSLTPKEALSGTKNKKNGYFKTKSITK